MPSSLSEFRFAVDSLLLALQASGGNCPPAGTSASIPLSQLRAVTISAFGFDKMHFPVGYQQPQLTELEHRDRWDYG